MTTQRVFAVHGNLREGAPILAGATQTRRLGVSMSALESLADWKDLDAPSMARRLMGMTAEARTELREKYAGSMQGKEGLFAAAQL